MESQKPAINELNHTNCEKFEIKGEHTGSTYELRISKSETDFDLYIIASDVADCFVRIKKEAAVSEVHSILQKVLNTL